MSPVMSPMISTLTSNMSRTRDLTNQAMMGVKQITERRKKVYRFRISAPLSSHIKLSIKDMEMLVQEGEQ